MLIPMPQGGHVETYHDPISGKDIDYGVEAYLQYGNSSAFFQRFNVPTTPYIPTQSNSVYVNIADGTPLTAYTASSFPDAVAAIQKWVDLIKPYSEQLLPGYFDFWDPEDIPADLLLPFGDFAVKYGIEAMMPTMAVISNVGVGGVKEILTLHVYFAFGQPVAQEFLARSLFVPDGYSNSEIYIRALDFLREDVLLQSRVTEAQREKDGVRLRVTDKDGHCQLICAKQLLFTPPPSTSNLAPFDLDAKETAPLSTWTDTYTFGAIARVPSIPINTTVYFTAPDAAPSNPLNIRDWPYTISFASAGVADEDLFEVLLSTNTSLSYGDAQGVIRDSIRDLVAGGTFEGATDDTCEILSFYDHNSILWRQSVEELHAGIVQEVYSLQGYRSTWYTGGLWSEDYTGNVWAFTEELLPRMLAAMG